MNPNLYSLKKDIGELSNTKIFSFLILEVLLVHPKAPANWLLVIAGFLIAGWYLVIHMHKY